jgi:hypothetical protein
LRGIKTTFFLIATLRCFELSAQNLVPNPSFETYTACPTGSSQLNKATPWVGTNGSSDYFNSCAGPPINVPNAAYGYQQARTGNAFSGIYFINGYSVNYREYSQVKLTTPLTVGDCYLVKFYVNCVNRTLNMLVTILQLMFRLSVIVLQVLQRPTRPKYI